MAGGSAPIAGHLWVGRRKPLVTSSLCAKVWGRAFNFEDGVEDPSKLLICQKGQEVSFKLLSRHMDFLPEGGCHDVIARRFGIASSLRHRDELFCQAQSFIFVEVL